MDAATGTVYPGEFDLTFQVPQKERDQHGRKLSYTFSVLIRRLPMRFQWRRQTQVSIVSSTRSTSGGENEVTNESGRAEEEDILTILRWPLVLGRLFGLVPIGGVWRGPPEEFSFRFRSAAAIYSLISTSVLCLFATSSFLDFLNVFFGFVPGKMSSKRLLLETREPLVLVAGAFVYLTFLLKYGVLIKLGSRWRLASKGIESCIGSHGQRPERAWPVLLTLAGIILPGMAMTNLLQFHDAEAFGQVVNELVVISDPNATSWEKYYLEHSCGINKVLPFGYGITVVVFAVKNFANFASVFSDAFIISMSQLLSAKFKMVHEHAKAVGSFPDGNILPCRYNMFRKGSFERLKENVWTELRKKHLICLTLLWDAEELLSPLIFMSYMLNTYIVAVQLHESAIRSGTSVATALINWTSLFYFLLKLIYLSAAASKIHYYAHAVSNCIQKCPHGMYSPEVERLELFLGSKTVGLTGLDCFTVTKSFLISVGSVIFTFEIILFTYPGINGSKG